MSDGAQPAAGFGQSESADGRHADAAGPRLQIYADGCFEPRTKTGGWSFIAIRDGVEIASEFGGVDRASNNAMELLAVLNAALWIGENAIDETAIVWSDSVYAVNGCNNLRQIWKSWSWRKKGPNSHARSRPIADQEMWQAVDAALCSNPSITIAWCKGHSGILGNERADRLAEFGRHSLEHGSLK